MELSESKKLYKEIKKRGDRILYNESRHCPLVLHVMSTIGTMAEFCLIEKISEPLFYKWLRLYPIFNECYLIGKMFSKANWEREYEDNKDDKDFDVKTWRITGARRYGYGKGKIKLLADPDADPYTQYKQIIAQAAEEDFSASELKQVMESINVGRGAYETFKLQGDIDDLNSDFDKMKSNSEYNKSANKTAPKIN